VYEHISFEQSEKSSSAFLKHILDESNAIIEDFESLGQLANSVFDIYAANLTIELNKSSHDLNRVMQRLSIMTSIFLPLSFIVGVYGMNIEGMPELKWPGFYFFLWGAMIGIVSILLVLFKKLKWY
jgi:magnesium transporter